MAEQIKVKCTDNCNQFYHYTLDNFFPVALTAEWRNDESKVGMWGGLLPQRPEIGKNYELLIQGSLEIDLSENFWAAYFNPYTTHEGIVDEIGINSLAFCLCRKTAIIEINEKSILLNVEILDILDLTFSDKLPKTEYKSSIQLDKEVESPYFYIDNFNKFSLIIINVQSDIGWTFIISKQNFSSRIIAENFWDFHQNIWQFNNEILTKEQEARYGITHRVLPDDNKTK